MSPVPSPEATLSELATTKTNVCKNTDQEANILNNNNNDHKSSYNNNNNNNNNSSNNVNGNGKNENNVNEKNHKSREENNLNLKNGKIIENIKTKTEVSAIQETATLQQQEKQHKQQQEQQKEPKKDEKVEEKMSCSIEMSDSEMKVFPAKATTSTLMTTTMSTTSTAMTPITITTTTATATAAAAMAVTTKTTAITKETIMTASCDSGNNNNTSNCTSSSSSSSSSNSSNTNSNSHNKDIDNKSACSSVSNKNSDGNDEIQIKIENCDESIAIKTEETETSNGNGNGNENENTSSNGNGNGNLNDIGIGISSTSSSDSNTNSNNSSNNNNNNTNTNVFSPNAMTLIPADIVNTNVNTNANTQQRQEPHNIDDEDNKDNINVIATATSMQQNQQDNQQQQLQHQSLQQHQQPNNEENIEVQSDPSDLIFARPKPVPLTTVNPHIICNLCHGYLIDATTIVECLHSFCHSCLTQHLRTKKYCPRCEMMINAAKPNIKSDTTLQAIVYKLVPGLYEKELMRKRAFYKDRPEDAALATPEQRGEDTEHLIFSPSDYMSLSLEYADIDEYNCNTPEYAQLFRPRYIQCPAKFTVAHMKKFVVTKFQIDTNRFIIDIMYKVKTIVLLDHYTLMDIAYIYTWKRDAPMRFFFRVKECLRPVVRPLPKTITKQEFESANNTNTATISDSRLMTVVHTPVPPAVTSKATSNKFPLPLAEIKVEDEIENVTGTATPTSTKHSSTEVAKRFEIVSPRSASDRNSIGGGTEKSPTDNLKITIVSKPVKDVKSSGDAESSTKPKQHKEKRVSFSNTVVEHGHSPKDERKVENIKLKIDLSKQNSVTIINMSDPERKEIVKPMRASEKEWKVKSKKEKEGSNGFKTPLGHHKSTAPLTVPPLTLKADRMKSSPKHSYANHAASPPPPPPPLAIKISEEDRKSQFLKAFSLTPISEVKPSGATTVNRQTPSPKFQFSPQHHLPTQKSPPKMKEKPCDVYTFKEPLKSSVPQPFSLSKSFANAQATKRKNKDPMKSGTKKPKLSSPIQLPLLKPTDDFKIRLPPKMPAPLTSVSNATSKQSLSNMAMATTTTATTMTITLATNSSTSSPQVATGNTDKNALKTTTANSTTIPAAAPKSNAAKLMPPPALPPLTRLSPGASSTKKGSKAALSSNNKSNNQSLSNALTPHPTIPGIQIAPPGNRTPIAKRYQPILPKSERANPFASLGSNKKQMLQIKSLINDAANKSMKVYGPTTPTTLTSTSISTPTSTSTPPNIHTNTVMGPPPLPKPKPSNFNATSTVHQQSRTQSSMMTSSKIPTSIASSTVAGSNKFNSSSSSSSSSFLNFALYNASKSKGNEVPPGCRTPIYTPSSPIYSPSSPQYVPNYNIPTVPQYKYTPKPNPANGGDSLLHSILSGNNSLSSGLFPSPPVKKSTDNILNAIPTSTVNNMTTKKPETQNTAPKRVYPFTRSPSPVEDPPEKQLKVKSLLNSCNINIPSSLSITITREDGESQSNNVPYPKHKSPVNNYIEILKLPDQPTAGDLNSKRQSPPVTTSSYRPNLTTTTTTITNTNSTATTTTNNNIPKGVKISSGNSTPPTHILMPPPKTSPSTSLNVNTKLSPSTANKTSTAVQRNNNNGSNGNSSKAANQTMTTSNNCATSNSSSNKTTPKSPQKIPSQQETSSKASAAQKLSPSSTQLDKKIQSPEKRNAQSAAGVTTSPSNDGKSPKSPSTMDNNGAKKFRPILPRQEAQPISEVVPPKVTTASVIGTYSSPSGVSVKVHGNKKVPQPKKSPVMQQQQQQQQQQQHQQQQLPQPTKTPPLSMHQQQQQQLKSGVPRTIASSKFTLITKPGTPPMPISATTTTTTPKRPNLSTPPPTLSPNGIASNRIALTNQQKMSSPLSVGVAGTQSTLDTSVPLPVAMLNAGPSGINAVAANANAASVAAGQPAFTKLLKENLLRAQAAAAASPAANMFYSYANAANAAAAAQLYNPSPMYSYQQAYILEQLSRMQRANNEVLSEYMKTLKAGMEGSANGNVNAVGVPTSDSSNTTATNTAAVAAVAAAAAAAPTTITTTTNIAQKTNNASPLPAPNQTPKTGANNKDQQKVQLNKSK